MAGPALKVSPPVVPVGVMLKATRDWLLSLAGPTLMAEVKLGTVCAPASSFTVAGLSARLKVGASLTALTVMVKVWAALVLTWGEVLEPLSVSVTLNVAVPLALGAAW